MRLLSDLYDVSLKRYNREASREGWIRPTIGECYKTNFDFSKVYKHGTIKNSFTADVADQYDMNGISLSKNFMTIPHTGNSSTTLTPVRSRIYLNNDWNRTNACNSPSGAPSGNSGQFGYLTLGVNKFSGGDIQLIRLYQPKYWSPNACVDKLYTAYSRVYCYSGTRVIFQTVTNSTGGVYGRIYRYTNSTWYYSNTYQMSPGDRLYIEHGGYARPDYIYGGGMRLEGVDRLYYPTNSNATIETTDLSSMRGLDHVVGESISFEAYSPTGTTIKVLVSFDKRNTWKKWNGSEYTTATNVATEGNTLSELANGFPGTKFSSGASLDFRFYMNTTSTYNAPVIRSVTVTH